MRLAPHSALRPSGLRKPVKGVHRGAKNLLLAVKNLPKTGQKL